MSSSGITWYQRDLFGRFAALPAVFFRNLEDHAQEWQARLTEYMQANAPWEDRTGDARDELETELDRSGLAWSFILHHTVEYGLWLEVRWSGRYAIIVPTIEALGPELMADMTGFMGRLG